MKTNQSARAAYKERNAKCHDLLKAIADRLDHHTTAQAQLPDDWAYVGDLGHVSEQLSQILAHLDGRCES